MRHSKKIQPKRLILFVGVLLAAFLILFKLPLFVISNIQINSIDIGCVDEGQLKKSSNLIGKNIFFVNRNQTEQLLISKYPCLKQVTLQVKFPSQIVISATTRKPIAKIQSILGSDALATLSFEATASSQSALVNWSFPTDDLETFLIDENGIIFNQAENQSLPTILSDEVKLEIGAHLSSDKYQRISSVLTQVPQLIEAGTLFRVKLLNDYLLLETRPKLIFGLQKDVLRQLASLQLILQKAKIENKGIESVDFRFDKPIVIYLPKK